MSATLTRQDLAEAVYAQVGLSRNESADIIRLIPVGGIVTNHPFYLHGLILESMISQ